MVLSGALGANGAEGNTFAQFLLAHRNWGRAAGWQNCRPSITQEKRDMASTGKNATPAGKDLLFKGVMLALIGLVVLISPAFIKAPGFQQAVAGSSLVGWFALVLGIAFIGQWAWRRGRP
jgi:hypothetical protein